MSKAFGTRIKEHIIEHEILGLDSNVVTHTHLASLLNTKDDGVSIQDKLDELENTTAPNTVTRWRMWFGA